MKREREKGGKCKRKGRKWEKKKMGSKRIKKIRNREDLRQKSTIGIKNDMWPERKILIFQGGRGDKCCFLAKIKISAFTHLTYLKNKTQRRPILKVCTIGIELD
jgi:hypothetical protein